MRCSKLKRERVLAMEAGQRDPQHLLSCRPCRRIHDGYRDAVKVVARLPEPINAPDAWQTRVWARVARNRPIHPRRTPTRMIMAAYATVLLLFGILSVNAYAQGHTAARRAQGAMQALNKQVDHTIAHVEAREAQDDVRYQLVHVAYAQLQASRPDASDSDKALVRARERALDYLRTQHSEALARVMLPENVDL